MGGCQGVAMVSGNFQAGPHSEIYSRLPGSCFITFDHDDPILQAADYSAPHISDAVTSPRLSSRFRTQQDVC
jgi:hypothetical protein